ARVTRVAIARLTRIVHAELERREPRLRADLVRDDLVAGNARLDVDGRLLDLDAREIRPRAPAVIARPVEQRAAAVVRQVADLNHVVAERFERLHHARERRAERALLLDVPVLHVDAV